MNCPICMLFMQQAHFKHDTADISLALYVLYPAAWSPCLDKISSMKSLLLLHAERHQWRAGSPPICLIWDRILLYICMWQGYVCVPGGVCVKALDEALHMQNLGFSKSETEVSSLSSQRITMNSRLKRVM